METATPKYHFLRPCQTAFYKKTRHLYFAISISGTYKGCAGYVDFREMLAKETRIDACKGGDLMKLSENHHQRKNEFPIFNQTVFWNRC